MLVGLVLAACQAPDARLEEAGQLFQHGQAAAEQRRFREAIALYERALGLREEAGAKEDHGLGLLIGALAEAYGEQGNYAEALPLYERTVAILEKVHGRNHPEVATSLDNLGLLHWRMGEYAKALHLQEQSLAIFEKAYGRDHLDVAVNLNNLALVHRSMGEYTKALALYERSLAIHEKILGRDHAEVAGTLGNLALLYKTMGQHAKALPLYERSLEIDEKVGGGEHPNVARTLGNMGVLFAEMGESAKALSFQERSLAIAERAYGPEHPEVARTLQNLALAHNARDAAKVQALLERSLAIYEKTLGPDHPQVGIALHNLAAFKADKRGEPASARPLFERALRNANAAGAPELAWRAQVGLRDTLAAQKQPALAVFFGKQAVNGIQALRAGLSGQDRDLQRSFLHGKEHAYRRLAELLIDQGRLPEAQQVLAMLKEEELFDFIRRDAAADPRSTQAALTGREEGWQKRYREVSERLGTLGAEREQLRRKAVQGLSLAEEQRRAAVDADLETARVAFDRFLAQLTKEIDAAGAVRAREVGERGLKNLRALQGTLGSLGEGVVALHYIMGEKRLSILLTTSSVQIARSVAVKSADLNGRIQQFRQELQTPSGAPLPIARELYDMLIAPVAADLKQLGAQTLMVSLDGALRYLPVAALHDGRRYLVEDYRIAILTEAARDKLKDAPSAQWRVAAFGVTQAVKGFSPLPAVRQELEGIVKAKGRGVLPGEMHLDDAFTAERVRKALTHDLPVLHVASHFVFRPGTESNSFLLLGKGGRLTLEEMKAGRLDFRYLDLVTLSACDTATGGGHDENGAEIEGFGALAQQQGARAVLATLWPVADASTGMLMQRFYRARQENAILSKAEALRQAQIAFIRGVATSGESGAARGLEPPPDRRSSSSAGYTHPFYWAPFILMGNWL